MYFAVFEHCFIVKFIAVWLFSKQKQHKNDFSSMLTSFSMSKALQRFSLAYFKTNIFETITGCSDTQKTAQESAIQAFPLTHSPLYDWHYINYHSLSPRTI